MVDLRVTTLRIIAGICKKIDEPWAYTSTLGVYSSHFNVYIFQEISLVVAF